ncbi:hypothetical protein QTP88_019828 [Uroleucon formosanum]
MVCPRDVYAARWTSDLAGAERIAELRQSSGIFEILFEKQQLNPGAFWSLAKNKHQDLSMLKVEACMDQ